MKVIVKDRYLNVRVGDPSVNAPCYQFIAPGSQIEVDGNLYKGDPYEGIDTWMKDAAGNYYWSGGIQSQTGQQTQDVLSVLNIREIWNAGETGDRATVAILDSGISVRCSDITEAVGKGIAGGFNSAGNRLRNFVASATSIDDDLGHGSHCAGLIASRNKSKDVGIARDCTLYVGKITDKSTTPSVTNMIKGLRWAAGLDPGSPQDVDIISMSCGSLLNIPDMQPTIDEALAKGKILVFAIGNRGPGSMPDGGNYPALCNGVISVGAVDMNNDFQAFSYESNALTISCPGCDIHSYWLNGEMNTESGTSQATAICAGIIALMVSQLKKNNAGNIQQRIMELLLGSNTRKINNYQYRFIEPLRLFNTLKQTT